MSSKKLNYILAGLLVLSFAYLLFDKLYLDRRAVENKQLPAVSYTVKAKNSIAVLPFVDLSPEKDQEYFVDGLSEEILNSLAQIPDLSVIARTESFSFKDSNKSIQEIASILGVEYILEGAVRKAGNALRITAQLIRAEDVSPLWSKTYDRELKDIFAVQEDIATAVASELKATLGIGKSLKQLGGTDNEKAYELYLVSKGLSGNIAISDIDKALESINSAVALDPKFALAWALKACIHQTNANFADPDVHLAEGLQAAQKAIELEPNLAEAYAVLGGQKSARGEWVEAESAYRKAIALGDESALVVGNYSAYLLRAGYLKKVNKFLEVALRNDPLNQIIRSNYVNSFIYLGDKQRAEEEQKSGLELFGERFDPSNEGHLRLNFKEYSLDEMLSSPSISDDMRHRIKSPEDMLAEMKKFYTDENSYINQMVAAYFGDPELALYVMEKSFTSSALAIQDIWYPIYNDVRRLPGFKELVKRSGLVDYWNEFGWPDLCRPLENGDFECD